MVGSNIGVQDKNSHHHWHESEPSTILRSWEGNSKTLPHLHVGYRSKARANFSEAFFCALLAFIQVWPLSCGLNFPGMKVPAGLLNNSQAFLLFPSLSRISHEALSCLINSFSLVRKKPTELASARLPGGSKWIPSGSLHTHSSGEM